jgi:PAS domain-containing protein
MMSLVFLALNACSSGLFLRTNSKQALQPSTIHKGDFLLITQTAAFSLSLLFWWLLEFIYKTSEMRKTKRAPHTLIINPVIGKYMKTDVDKSKDELLTELNVLRQQVERLEVLDAGLKQAEGALRESEARYRTVVEDQTEFIARMDLDGTITFVNESYCRLLNKTSDELIGKTSAVSPGAPVPGFG